MLFGIFRAFLSLLFHGIWVPQQNFSFIFDEGEQLPWASLIAGQSVDVPFGAWEVTLS